MSTARLPPHIAPAPCLECDAEINPPDYPVSLSTRDQSFARQIKRLSNHGPESSNRAMQRKPIYFNMMSPYCDNT